MLYGIFDEKTVQKLFLAVCRSSERESQMTRLAVAQRVFLDGERADRILPITGFLHHSTRFLPYPSTIHRTSYAPQRSC